MKKLLLLIFIFTTLNANLQDIKVKLIDEFAKLLFPRSRPTIYINAEEFASIDKLDDKANLTPNCIKADFLILDTPKDISKQCLSNDKVILVTNYRAYMKSKLAVGAVFWQKGRLNIIFKKDRLERFSINLPKRYNKYVE